MTGAGHVPSASSANGRRIQVADPTVSMFAGIAPTVVSVWRPSKWAFLASWARRPQPWTDKHHFPAFSLARFRNGRRCVANVIDCCGLVLDFDERDGCNTNEQQLREVLGRWVFIAYTSKSHTLAAERWRVVLPLARAVTTEEYRLAVTRLGATLPQPAATALDPMSANPAQIYWQPARQVDHPYKVITVASGRVFSPDAWLVEPHSTRSRRDGRRDTPRRPSLLSNISRARRYVQRMEPAIQGQNGSAVCFRAARVLRQKFGLSEDAALEILREDFNPRCQPPWSEAELRHKVRDADPSRTRIQLGSA